MMGMPGMRSIELPTMARLDVGRVRFLLRCRVLESFSRTFALFDGHGGQLDRMRPRVYRHSPMNVSRICSTEANS